MNAQEFIEKFPDRTEVMDNCCMDMACPECGARDSFHVSFFGMCIVYDNGTDDAGDHEWDRDSACTCDSCGHGGTVGDFTIDGLDQAISELKEQEETEV